jgi:catechol 2,3-dioxygenase-like lactoylglutathione lyase family enzyme
MKMRLTPMLPVRSVATSVEFYGKLGFDVEQRNDDWGWARLRRGDCQLMLDQSINPHVGIPRPSVLYLYPENVVEYHRQVRANGLAVPELDVTFYGMTEFRIEDPDGNRLWIGQDRSAGAAGEA